MDDGRKPEKTLVPEIVEDVKKQIETRRKSQLHTLLSQQDRRARSIPRMFESGVVSGTEAKEGYQSPKIIKIDEN